MESTSFENTSESQLSAGAHKNAEGGEETDNLKSLLKQLNAVNRMKDPARLLDLRNRAQQAIPDCESKRDALKQKAVEADDVLEKLALQQESEEITDVISKLQDRLKAITNRAKELTA